MRFSLRTFLAVTLLGSATLGFVLHHLRSDAIRRSHAIRQLVDAGYRVHFSDRPISRLYQLVVGTDVEVRDVYFVSSTVEKYGEKRQPPVDLDDTSRDGTVLSQIRLFPELQYLHVSELPISPRDIQTIGGQQQLISLDLSGIRLSTSHVSIISASTSVLDLKLHNADITDESLLLIGRMPQLMHLLLGANRITDDGLKHLTHLDNLQGLTLTNQPFTENGIRHLASLPMLNAIFLDGTLITDDVVDVLRQFKKLKAVSVSRTKVTAVGIKKMKRWLTVFHEVDHLE